MVYCAKGEASHKENTWNTSGFLVDLLSSYLINHFFRVNCPEKRDFSNFEFNFCQLHHLELYFLNREHCCHDLWDPFFQNSRDLDSRLGGCVIRGIDYLFFESTRRIRRKEDSRLI
jgi:hypothetical protein